MALLMAAKKHLSAKVDMSPRRISGKAFITSDVQSSSLFKVRMELFAFFSSKLASSIESPASARHRRDTSAEYSSMDCRRVLKLPVLLDIFSPLSCKCPFARIDRGQCSFGKIAA